MRVFGRAVDRIGNTPPALLGTTRKGIEVNRKLSLAAGVMTALLGAFATGQTTVTPGGPVGRGSPTRAPAFSLQSVSFPGYLPGAGVGTNATVSMPAVYRDEALEFKFDGPIDVGIFGGFLMSGGTPVQFLGAAPSGPAIPYFAFVNQGAASASLQIRENVAGGPLPASYVVGRHATKPDTLVFDPRVPAGNPFGLPASLGLKAVQEYAYIIAPGNGITSGNYPATPAGASGSTLPVVFTGPVAFIMSGIFRTDLPFAPNPVPPTVVSIVAQSGAAGTPANPILAADSFIVTFSQPVTAASIDLLSNFIVRNTNITNPTNPGGILVPGTVVPQTAGAVVDSVWVFTPVAAYGPGVTPSQGYDIEVRIGSFGQPASTVPPILGLLSGFPGTQLPLGNSLSQVFRSTPCGACTTPAMVAEGFNTNSQLDVSFVQTFGPQKARWNDASAPGQFAGRLTTGSAGGNTPATLGTRIQILVDPQPPTTSPAGLYSPFDSSAANSGGLCGAGGCNLGPAINPGGGSHIMHLYEAGELLNTEDSLEQIEWSPLNSVTFPSVYPNYKIWCGVSNIAAPITGGTAQGMTAVYDANYTLTPYQAGIPITPGCANPMVVNPRKVPCGSPTPYTVFTQITQFYPYPLLSPCFDYSTSLGASGAGVNLLFEQDIDPGQQSPNFNRYRATNFIPVRRLIAQPLSLVSAGLCAFNQGGTFDIYRARFTFVGIVGQNRSLWYDTGTANPNYLSFVINPPVATQPLGTQSTWILEGTDSPNPGPGTTGVSGVYVNAAGVTFPNVLSTTISQLRYFRFRVEFRGNNLTNATPSYNSVAMAYTF
jgi:hypothetical protein